ncbi:MAG: ABC transporter substrate-binding protein [Spirochaetaceae bacterium]|nr:ABC transporter substrate-binding protein [Spirochaetaceae bacterium]
MIIVQNTITRTFAVALVLILTATGLWATGAEEAPAAAADKRYVTDPVTGKAVSAPQYGGKLTYANVWDLSAFGFDAWFSANALLGTSGVVEKLGIGDWAIDRDTYPFMGGTLLPLNAIRGTLAESWEQPDDTTYIVHIRKGVNWHDKAPMNGRELTAYDVEHTFHRLLGNKLTGTEFSAAEPNTSWGDFATLPWESVTATDKYTVVFKLKEPERNVLERILDWWNGVIQPPEVIEQYGDMKDWRNVVGTGPYTITDFVADSSITYTKNPNYWGFDEKYPENRLPYIDEVEALTIKEPATRLAGLRTAKLDFVGFAGNTQIMEVDQLESLLRTNPELVVHPYLSRSNNCGLINVSKPPLDDVRVRHALQMAIDMETINRALYNGDGDATPQGLIGRVFKEYVVPFEEWSDELKGYYTYDVAGAEKLLDEAGYPRGADGIRFKITRSLRDIYDLSFIELSAEYWRDIGVDVDILAQITAEWVAGQRSGDFEITSESCASASSTFGNASRLLSWYRSDHDRNASVRDAQFDAGWEALLAATTVEEEQRLAKDLGMRTIEQHWMLWGLLSPQYQVHQPWVIGYNGEAGMGGRQHFTIFPRLWIDSELKEAMGY